METPTGYSALAFVGFTDKGAYDSSATYVTNDLVHYNNSIWRCLFDDVSGVTPSEGTNWTIFIESSTDAAGISYDHADSTLSSDTVKAAIDELDSKMNNMSSDTVKLTTTNATDDSITFGVDSSGNYGYFKKGSSTLVSFKSASDVEAARSEGEATGAASVTLSTSGDTVTASNGQTATVAAVSKASSGTNYGNVAVSNGTATITATSASSTVSYPITSGWINSPIKVNQSAAYNAGLAAGKATAATKYGSDITVSVTKANGSTSGSATATATVPSGSKLWANLFPSIITMKGDTSYHYVITTGVSYSLSGTTLTISLSASGSSEVKSVATAVVRLYVIS